MMSGCLTVPSGDDTADANRVTDALVARYRFPVMSKVVPDRPAVWARPGARGTQVITNLVVIGVTDPGEQDKVVAIVKGLRSSAMNPIVVYFFREERVERRPNPATGGTSIRTEEVDLLRSVRVD